MATQNFRHEREPAEMNSQRRQTGNSNSVDICQRFGKSIEEALKSSQNEEFRSNCLTILGIENVSDVGEKVSYLSKKLIDENKKK